MKFSCSHFRLNKRSNRTGIALVITLVLLSAIGTLTVIFLATTQRGRASAAISTSQVDAELMSEAGRERALAMIVAQALKNSNAYNIPFFVSTNYINPLGYTPGRTELTNVSYKLAVSGADLNRAQMLDMLSLLYYDPRLPVFVQSPGQPSEFRFYYDINRNGTNEVSTSSNPGEPEFIGMLQRHFRVRDAAGNPDPTNYPHAGNNRAPGRYAYWVVPVGQNLNLNYIHNNSKTVRRGGGDREEGYLRNEGVGTHEINLAAFLHDLNPSPLIWTTYGYTPDVNVPNNGTAFEDAQSLLSYRQAKSWKNLSNVVDLFGPTGANAFQTDGVDGYGDNLANQLRYGYFPAPDDDNPTNPWHGSDFPNVYGSLSELFDPTKSSPFFVDRLTKAVNDPALTPAGEFNRQTFQRLMAQMSAEPILRLPSQMHVNYANLGTNRLEFMLSWRPEEFYTNAVERMLKVRIEAAGLTNVPTSYTNITLFPNNQLSTTNPISAELIRVFQLAANIYNSTTNIGAAYPYAPASFRPVFSRRGDGTVYIHSFTNVAGNADLALKWLDLDLQSDRDQIQVGVPNHVHIYGVPMIVGVKKGLPNFNEFSVQTAIQVTRKMEVTRPSKNPLDKRFTTNSMYVLGITNRYGLEAWNSYSNSYVRPLTMGVNVDFFMVVTNGTGQVIWPESGQAYVGKFAQTFMTNNWQAKTFSVPVSGSIQFLANSAYFPDGNPAQFVPISGDPPFRDIGSLTPQWHLVMTNRVQYYLLDGTNLLDFVNLADAVTHVDITKELIGGRRGDNESSFSGQFWLTNINAVYGAPEGALNQLDVALRRKNVNAAQWDSYSNHGVSGRDKENAIQAFREFMGEDPPTGTRPFTDRMQTPFNPTRKILHTVEFQANDPLLHYTVNQLRDPNITTNNVVFVTPPNEPRLPEMNLGKENSRYSPWARGKEGDPNDRNPNFKDAGVRSSDNWEFPTNKWGTLGMIGRVHRGTPWQTVSLKALITNSPNTRPFQTNDWLAWAGSLDTYPTYDRPFLELFTTAPNENARRGTLPVNQTNIAAWSAVLSGVPLLEDGTMGPRQVIQPNSNPLRTIVDGIGRSKTNRTVYPNGVLNNMGDILNVPELSVANPFLIPNVENHPRYHDIALEWLPSQTLSLLSKGEARYAIYSLGQALTPARDATSFDPSYYQLVTNYTVKAEVLTRTIVRIEFDDPATKNKPRAIVESFNILPPE